MRDFLARKMYLAPIINRANLPDDQKMFLMKFLMGKNRPFDSENENLLNTYEELVVDSVYKVMHVKYEEVSLKNILEFIERICFTFFITVVTKTTLAYYNSFVTTMNALSNYLEEASKLRPEIKFLQLRLQVDVGFYIKTEGWSTKPTTFYESVLEFVEVEKNMKLLLSEIGWTKELLMTQLQTDYVRILDRWVIVWSKTYERVMMKQTTILLNYILDNNLLDRYATLWYFRAIELAEKYQERQYFTQAHYLIRAASHVIRTNRTDVATPLEVEWMLRRSLLYNVKQSMYLLLFDAKIQIENTKCVEFKKLAGVKPNSGLCDKVPRSSTAFIKLFNKANDYMDELRDLSVMDLDMVKIINQWDEYYKKVAEVQKTV